MNEAIVTYADLVEILGEAKALELSKLRGGRGLFVTSLPRLKPDSPTAALLGMEAAAALAARFGGTPITVPVGPGRRARIWELAEAGLSRSAIAAEMRCHERTVYAILAAPRPRGLRALPEKELPPLLAYIAKCGNT